MYPEYLAKVMMHANEQRMAAFGEGQQSQTIKISQYWEEQLKAMPYLSCKYLSSSKVPIFVLPDFFIVLPDLLIVLPEIFVLLPDL